MKKNISKDFNEELFYQQIGEFVVSFQWTEHLIRQIARLCIDPKMQNFPNGELWDQSNNELLNNVILYHKDFIKKFNISTDDGYQIDFNTTIQSCHNYRKFRNNLLHSAYTELKADGDVVAIMRSNPKINKDPFTKDAINGTDLITAADIKVVMKKLAVDVIHLNFYFLQIKHWYGATEQKSV